MRESIYKSVDVVIFCFSLSNIEISGINNHLYSKDSTKESKSAKKRGSSSHISLGNVKTIWLPEFEKALGKEQPKDADINPDDKRKDHKLELPIKILVGTKGDQLFENIDTSLLAKDSNSDDESLPGTKQIKKSKTEDIKTDDEADEPNHLITQGSQRRVDYNDDLDALAEEFASR